MMIDGIFASIYHQLLEIPIIDPHSHVDPLHPVATSLEEILGYHYYTELAHSAGMDKSLLSSHHSSLDRVRAVLTWAEKFDNTVQFQWFDEIARTFLGFEGEQLSASHADELFDKTAKLTSQPDWEGKVLRLSNVERIFLTNEFDDPLTGFDTSRYVPCLRTDDLVFKLDQNSVQQRLGRTTGYGSGDPKELRSAIAKLFDHFTTHQAKACAISLPPDFSPTPVSDRELAVALRAPITDPDASIVRSRGVFWMLAEHCQAYRLPFDLMIGVNRRVYREGVHQGQDLFDGRLSLIQYAELFNAFPDVKFCISVLSSGLNQELVSYSWIFPNVLTCGHWWYSNVPTYVERDLCARLEAVPKTKQIGYYSDAYKLEFVLPKFNSYRRVLAKLLAERFVETGRMSEQQAVALSRQILRDNVQEIFNV